MNVLSNWLHSYGAFHANAFYAILYFLKTNMILIVVLFAVAYLISHELQLASAKFVNDQRRMI